MRADLPPGDPEWMKLKREIADIHTKALAEDPRTVVYVFIREPNTPTQPPKVGRCDMSGPNMKTACPKLKRLEKRLLRMFPEADEARISAPCGKLFLVLGYKRHTKDDPGQWVDQDGKPQDWEYLHEETVASGDTPAQLIESARQYKRCLTMSMSDFLLERLGWSPEVVKALKGVGL